MVASGQRRLYPQSFLYGPFCDCSCTKNSIAQILNRAVNKRSRVFFNTSPVNFYQFSSLWLSYEFLPCTCDFRSICDVWVSKLPKIAIQKVTKLWDLALCDFLVECRLWVLKWRWWFFGGPKSRVTNLRRQSNGHAWHYRSMPLAVKVMDRYLSVSTLAPYNRSFCGHN